MDDFVYKRRRKKTMNNITVPGQHNKSFFSKYKKNTKSQQQGCLPAKEQARKTKSLSI
jgi:hypothetical protein